VKNIEARAARRHAIAAAALAALTASAPAADWEISGQLRQELAVKTTDDQNTTNQNGFAANGVSHTNTGLAAALSPTLTRPAAAADKQNINWFATRVDVNLDGKLGESLKATIKLRGIVDETSKVDDAFGNRMAGGVYTGSGNPRSGDSFRQQFGGTAGGPLAWASKRALVDLPAAYLDYNEGPLWIRAGNQQIAWGEALFFRVADQPNGLDLRGHLFGVSEYSSPATPNR